MLLHEKHRPHDWDSVVGQPRAVATLRNRPHGGKAYWLTGKSGTGKTTLAYLIAADHASEFCIDEYDAGELTGAGVREVERQLSVRGLGKGGRCIIINEAHGLRADAIRALLVVLERIPEHVCYVFTTTLVGESSLFESNIDGSPLVGRCIPIALEQRGVAQPFAQRALDIARSEGLDGRPLADYVRLINDCRGSLRMALSRIEAGEMLP